jgi:hypothetical protein
MFSSRSNCTSLQLIFFGESLPQLVISRGTGFVFFKKIFVMEKKQYMGHRTVITGIDGGVASSRCMVVPAYMASYNRQS